MKKTNTYKKIFTILIGQCLEWYDYIIYGQLSFIIAKNLLAKNNFAEMISLFIFFSAFIVRPIGALIFGHIGDTIGRKSSMFLAMLLMGLSTIGIGLIPTYNSIGIYSSILLLIMRIFQGFALSGEFGIGIVYLLEEFKHSKYQSFIGSINYLTFILGSLLGIIVIKLSQMIFVDNFDTFGYKIPFFFGFFISILGFIVRKLTSESEVFLERKKNNQLAKIPFLEVCKKYKINLLNCISFALIASIWAFCITVYIPNLLLKIHNESNFFIFNIILLISASISVLLFGFLGDKIKLTKATLLYSFFSSILIIVSLYFFNKNILNIEYLKILAIFFGLIFGLTFSLVPIFLFRNFDTSCVATGMSLSVNLSALFGGFGPFFCSFIVMTFKGLNNGKEILLYMIPFLIINLIVLLIRYKKNPLRNKIS